MKTALSSRPTTLPLIALWIAATSIVFAQSTNFTVTTPAFKYAVNGVSSTNAAGNFVNNSPPLTLVAGNSYTFTMQASSFHPMVVATNQAVSGGPSASNFEYTNASPQAVFSGTITLTIPATDFPTNLYYQCNFHGFFGVITIIPPPPPNQIVSISVTTNIVLFSTGTDTAFKLVPQYSSNLLVGAWQAVPAYTNTFANGTNQTAFDRLDPICGPNVFLRISQQPPQTP